MSKEKKLPVNKIYKLIDLINSPNDIITASQLKTELLKIAKSIKKSNRKKNKKIKSLQNQLSNQ